MSNEQSLAFSLNNQLYPNQVIPTNFGLNGLDFLSGISQMPAFKPFVTGQLPFLATDWSTDNNLSTNNLIGNIPPSHGNLNSLARDNFTSVIIDPLRQSIASSLQNFSLLEQPVLDGQLTTTIEIAQQKIAEFFQQPDIANQLALAFGQGIDPELAKSVSRKLPNIQVVSDSVLGKANGAYALTSNTIFLAQSLVERGNQQEIVTVLVEEIGHSIDGHLNTQDATGDEGEIFAHLVNSRLNSENYQEMLTEDDHNQIIWNGQVLAVENYIVSQPIHSFAIQAGGKVTTNGSSDFDGNPLNVSDDAFIYAGKGFDLNGQIILPVQRNQAGGALTNSSGQLLLVNQAVVVAPGYLISASNGSNNYTNLNPPQVIAQQTIPIPSYASIKQEELATRIPAGATTVVLNVSPSPMNNANQWQKLFPAGGTASQPKVVRVVNGSLNIPNNVDLSNYVIVVENGDITLGSNNELTNVTLVATNVYFKNNQITNSSILAANNIIGNSKISFTGKNLLATGQGNITLNGATTGLDSAQNLRIVSQGQITLNGSVSARGEFRSVGNFLANGSSDIYGTIASLQDVRFNGNSTFTYANTGSNNPPPNVPTIQLQASSDTGISNSDRTTANSTPVIIGTGDVGATIKLVDNGTLIGQTIVGLDGQWQITTSLLIDGDHPLTASATNSAGITSTESAPLAVTIDTVMALPTLNLALPSDTGVAGDYRTKAAIVSLTGKTEANAEVILSGNPNPVTADSEGNFTFTNVALNPQANSFTVTATDIAGNSKSYTQTIYRTSPPTAISLSTPQVLENSTNDLLVGSLSTIDPDGVDNYVYSLIDNAGGRFKLAGDKILVDNGSVLDFEANQQHQIQVSTTDSEGDSFLQTLPIQIINSNESPTSLTLSNSMTAENVPGGSLIGDLSSTDLDVSDTSSFGLVAGSGDLDNSKFSVIDRQLVINQSPDFEAQDIYSIRLRVTDAGGLTLDRAFNISVTDVNEAPISIGLSSQVITENSSDATVIGTLTTLDPDVSDVANYQLVDSANGRFVLVGNELRVGNGNLLDFEVGKEHQIQVTSTDQGGLQVTQAFIIQVANLNEAPSDFALSNNLVPENSLAVGSLSTIDPDLADTHIYSLVSGMGDTDNSVFTITNNQLHFQVAPDFEIKSNYGLRISTTDADGLSIEKQLIVQVTNIDEAPTQLVLDITQVAENSPIGTLIGKFSTSDPDNGDSHAYTLVTGNGDQHNSDFSIINNELRLNFVPDFEAQSVYYLRVQTQDASGLTWQQELTVNILDLSENLAPTGIQLSNNNIAENSPDDTLIAQLSTIDLDVGNTHTYSLLDDAGGRFKLVGNELRVAKGSLLDHETATSHQIQIKTTDDGTPNLAYEQNLTIGVLNVNEVPGFSSQPVLSASNREPYSYTITTIDPDNGDTRLISTAQPLPSWLQLVNNGDGTAQLFGTPGEDDLGFFNISLVVTDAGGAKSLQEFGLGIGNSLVEGTSFNKRLELAVNVPATGGQLSFKLDLIQFDKSDLQGINDALEAALVDAQGKSLVSTFQSDRDAFFNWTEGENAITGQSTSFNPTTGVVTLDLTGAKAGAAKLVIRLVNDDRDTTTNVYLTDLALAPTVTPVNPAQSNLDTPNSPSPVDPNFFNSAIDVSPSIGADYQRTSFNAGSKELFVNVALKNQGSYGLDGNLVVVVNHISDPSVLVKNADGLTPEGQPYYTFKSVNGKLDPSQVTLEQTLVFKNPNGAQFSYDLAVLAEINAVPVIKSLPEVEVIGGKLYQYQVKAEDINGDTLSYKLLSSPPGMSIDAQTGLISWNTAVQEVGNYQLAVEVSDGRGSIARQDYNLAVIDTPPNRPPIFTSIPEVDAYVNTLYQYDANAIDPDEDNPLSFTLISGPDGIKVNSTTGVVNWTPQPAIILGDTVIGRIGSPGENDEFLFTGNIGQKIYLDSLKYSGDIRYLGINVYSPSGILVVNRASFNYNDSRLITLSENGNYKIVVDGDGSYTGSYGFSLIDPALVPIIQANEVINGTLSTGNEDDLYRFSGSQGQKIFIDQISNTGGTLDWVLYEPSNQVISSRNFQDMEVDLTRDGEYILALRGSAGFSQVVRYSFSVVTPELKDFELPLNQTVSGAILKKGGQDRYSFTGKAGQQIFFDSLGGKYLPFTLYDPNGRVVATLNNQTDHSPYEGFIFSMDGTYKIVIDGQGEAVGDYKFRLLDKAQAQEVPLDTDITGTFDNDGLGSIGYRFTLNESRYLFFDGQGGNGLWNLYSSNGQTVTSQNMASNLELQLDAGDYFLVVRGSGGGGLNYKLRVVTPEFSVTPMIVGDTVTGTITEKGEQDTYTFSGLAGQQLFFDGLGVDYLTVKILDPSGKQIYSSNASENRGAESGLIFSTNGTYRLIVDGNDESVGNYKFRLLDKAQANQLVLDTDITGTFDNGGLGAVSYQFTLTESRYLFFDGQGGNGVWTLYNSSGQRVFNQNMAYNSEMLLDAGDYFLVASGQGNSSMNYKFRVITPEFNTTVMSIGNTVSGALLEIGEQDTYTFSGSAGQQLFFDSLDSNPLSVKVLDSSGKQISLFNSNTDSFYAGVIVIPVTGDYRLIIDGSEESIGNYKFRLLDKAMTAEIPFDTDILGSFDNGGLGSVGYRFSVTGSHRLFFDGQGGNGRLSLYAPNGQYLNSLPITNDLELWLEPGDYFLIAQGAGGAGDFKFKIADRETRAAIPLVGTQMLLGSAITGSITAQRQKDTYLFNGVAGQQLFLDNLQASNSYIQYHLLDAVGRVIYSSNTSDLASNRDLIILATGVYRLVVDGLYGSSVGSYKFRLLDKAQAPDVPLDTTITGTFDNNGFGSNGYRFSLSNRQYVFFDGQEGSGLWTVYGANGQIISTQNISSNVEQWLDAGDYFLVANGSGSSVANYKFRIVTPELTVTPMILGETISGSISEKGEQDTYNFNGLAGQQLFFDNLAGGASPIFKVLDPNGKEIFNNNGYSFDFGPDAGLILSMDGSYRLIIDGSGETIGNYKFRLLNKAEATVIPLDTDITGTFDNDGFGSTGYRFTLNDSKYLFFDGQGGNGYLNLYNSSGQNISRQYAQSNSEFLLSAGEYFVVASGSGGTNTSYKFRIVTPELNTTSIAIGDTISGSISEKGEQDTYAFSGSAGQQLFFAGMGTDYLTAKILDPTGREIFNYDARSDQGPDRGLTFSMDGTYRLIIDGSDETIGNYKFRLIDKASAPVISLDTDITGTFDNEGLGSAAYKFSINQRQYLYVDALAGNGNWIIYSPNGQSIASASLSVDREFWAEAGEYLLVLNGQSSSSTNYQLRLVTPEFKTTAVNIGESVSTSISEKGEQDYYTFTGEIGQRIILDKLSAVTSRFAEFKLISPSGMEVLGTYLDGSNDPNPFTLTETGSYQIVVDGYLESIGNYGFRLLDLEEAQPLQLDAIISGQLNPGAATQLYKFSGAADTRLYLDSLSNIPNTTWVLYGAGNQIIAQSSFSDLEVVLPKNDIYFLAVRGNYSSPVDYQFRVIPTGQSITELSLGQLVTDTILKKGEQDTYSFNGQIGQKIFFDVVTGSNNIHSRLYSPTGILAADLVSANIATMVTLTETGTYKVIVDGDTDITGIYGFLLSDLATATKLLLNEPMTGQLAENGIPQLFSIKGTVGQTLRFDINDADASKVNWILYGDGNQVLKQSTGQAGDFDLMLPSSGIYSLAVFNRSTAQTNYQFTVTDITPARVETTGLDTLIGETAFSTRSGQITAGQIVEQIFTASAGKRIFLDSLDFDDSNVIITILNPNGTTLLSNSASQDSLVTQLSQSGTYKIVVKGTTPTSTGDYRFSVFEVLTEAPAFDEDVRKLSLNAEVTKTLDYGRSTHVLSFQGNVGQRLFYDGMLPDGLDFNYANVNVRLVGPNGENIFEINQNSLYNRTAAAAQDAASFILNSSGTYNLMIMGNQDTPATYRFKMWDLAGVETLKLNKRYGNNLQRGSDTKFYKIQGEAGKRLYFDAIAGQSRDQWVLYRLSDAKAVFGASFSSDFEYVMPDNGEYVLAIRGDSTTPGSYQFQVTSTKDAIGTLIPGDGETNSQEDEGLGTFNVNLQVDDLHGGVSFQKYKIRLHQEEGNSAPVIVSEALLKGFFNRLYTYDVDAVDADNDSLAYYLVDGPEGMIIDSLDGKITWQSPIVGEHQIKVRVTDTAGGENTQTFTITISGSVNGTVQGNVYNDLDKNGDRKITNPNNLTPYAGVEIGDRFKENYTPYKLELPNGLPEPIGPMVFLPGDPDTMLIGGGIASCGGSIYKVKVLRGEGGHIIGFDDDGDPNTPYVAEFYQYAPYLSGLAHAPDGSLLTTITYSPFRGIGFVPEGIPGAGQLKSTGSNTGFYTQTYLGNGQYNNPVQSGLIGLGSRSFAYVSNTAFDFEQGAEILIANARNHEVLAYEIDSAGNPIAGTADVFLKDLNYALGALVDPLTGDTLVNSNNTILAVRGLGPLTGNEPGLAGNIVYVDSDKDGVRDAGEEYTTTDIDGKYSFTLTPGSYQLRQELSQGWTQTEPIDPIYREVNIVTNKLVTGIDFGNFGVAVNTDNVAPKITSEANLQAISEEKYLYRVKAVDLNGDSLSYELVLKPEGMAIAANGTVAWKPTIDQVGSHRVVVRVSDADGAIDLQTFDVVVKQGNSAPIITSVLPKFNPQVGKEFQYQVKAQDLDSNTLSYALVSNPYQPTGVSIDAQTGVVKWTPTVAQVGGVSVYGDFNELVAPWQVTVKVADGKGAEAYQSLDLLVDALKVNQAPVINSTPRKFTQMGNSYFYAIDATDPNGDALTYSLVNPPAGMTIQDGLISWRPTAAQSGVNSVILRVSDGSLAAVQEYELLVTNQAPNHVPQITSIPELVTNLERPYNYDLKGSDQDGDLVAWSLDEAPVGMVIDVQTGALRWQPLATQVGEHTVAVRLTDSLGAASVQQFVMEVNGVNTPPVILSVPPTKAAIGELYSYVVEGEDPENDELRYMLTKHPEGMKINGVTGQITWTPTAGQVGRQDVEVEVTDTQGAVASQLYKIEVISTPTSTSTATTILNLAPTITSKPLFGADVNKPYQYQVVGKDPENGVLSYALKAAPVGMIIDAVTGLITWNNPVVGNALVEVKVTDAGGLASIQGYTLATKQNHAPVINSTPATTVVVGNSYRYDVVARDVDGDALTYKIDEVSKGLGVSIDLNGRISWKPTNINVGAHPVTVTVTDAIGAVTEQTYNLEVLADSIAPTVKLVRGTNIADIGDTVSFQVQATDNVGIRNRQLLINDQAITLDANGVGTYVALTAGVLNVQAIVTDANGNVSNSSTTVNVIDSTDVEAPIVSVNFPTDNITGITDIVGSINDPNLDYYVLEVAPAGTEDYKEVFRGTSAVTNGVLGKFDPTNLVNDTYTLRLSAFDTTGRGTVIDQDVEVSGDLKLGNFRLSFTDIAVPVTGIPITLTRTYDSLTSKLQDEFGYGWRMEFRDTALRTSLKKDETYEEIGYRTVGFSEGDRVYITLPGGKREGFTFSPVQLGINDKSLLATFINGVFKGRIFKPTFVADKGNTTTLTVPGSTFNGGGDTWLLQIPNQPGKYVTMGGLLYHPEEQVLGNRYFATTKDGTEYEINATTGKLERVKDTNGNTLTYSDTEIVSSNGQKVVFDRDNQGRIISMTDPLGAKVKYEYDAKGDLVAVIDRDGNTTKYEYNSTQAHYLDKIIDPLGREAVKTEYDAQGRLKKTTNASGNGVEFVYDPENSIQVVKDALGNATTYEYDTRGNILTEVDALGGITRRTYDEENNLLSETDAEGRTNTYTYDAQKNQLFRTDANGNVYRYTYGVHGRIASSIDPLGNTTTYTLDRNGNPLTKTNAMGGVTTYTHDGYGNQTSVTNALGQTTYSQYDRNGNLTQETDALGRVTKYTYDSRGNRLTETKTVTTPTGVRTLIDTKTYDRNGNVTSWLDAEDNLVQYEYNAANQQTLVIDALGRKTISRYDVNDRLVETVFADGLSNYFTYDANGKKTQSIDREGQITILQYDATGRSTALISPDDTPNNPNDNPRKLLEYDKAGWLKAIVDEQGNRQEWIYDAARNQTGSRSYVDNTPITTNNIYDAAGRKVSTTDPLGHITRYAYDGLGRLVETRYADGATSKTTFDAIGNEIAKIDRANHQTKYEYDALQQLIAVIDPTNSRTSYNYNELGDLIVETDANGHQTKYEYDGLKRRIAVIRPLGQRSMTAYDKAGNAISYTDFNGQTTNYAYGLGNLLIDKQLSDGSQTSITYTATGKRQSVTDSRGSTIYTYNPQGQITKVVNPDGQQISYAYDPQGHLSTVTTVAGTTAYTYGALNRLQQVTDNQGGITAYTYDLAGNLVNTRFANGITETRGYDSLNRLVSVTNTNAQSQIISSYAYILDAVGNKLQSLENSGRKVDYIYDTRDRLLSEKITDAMSENRTIAYTYDAVGNRLTLSDSVAGDVSYSYNENDWLVKETHLGEQTQYTYDNNGSLLSKFHNANDKTTYDWNLDHRLSGVQITDTVGTHQSTYTYDVDGNRVAQTVNGVNTSYLVDTNRSLAQVALEYDSQGVKTSYTYAGGVISQTSNNVQSFYISDGHSGVRIVTNVTGAVTDAYNYDGYGNLLQSVGNVDGDRYRGESRDSETGLQYLRARYYDSSTGRFLCVDPFEGLVDNPVSRHRYLYGNNNPITYLDPSGNFSIAQVGATFSILETLIIATAVQSSIGVIAGRLSGNINWSGKLSSTGAKGQLLGIDVNTGISLLTLKTDEKETSPYLYPNLKSVFEGKWLQISVGGGISVPDILKPLSPNSLSVNSSVVAFSPRVFGATPATFAGTYAIASLTTGASSPKYFRAGFGWGGSAGAPSPNSINKVDTGISLKEGVSIPMTFFPA